MSEEDRFNWNDDDSIVLQRQPAVAVYANKCGQVVIRGEPDFNEEDDQIVTIEPDQVVRFVYSILDAAGLDMSLIQPVGGGFADVERPPPRGMRGADRQGEPRRLPPPLSEYANSNEASSSEPAEAPE